MLFCNSTGHPPPHITWRFLSESEKPLGYEESLTLSNVNRTQTGTYLCTASNNVTNSKTASIQVTVNCKNRIIDPLSFNRNYVNFICRGFRSCFKKQLLSVTVTHVSPEILLVLCNALLCSEYSICVISFLQYINHSSAIYVSILLCFR